MPDAIDLAVEPVPAGAARVGIVGVGTVGKSWRKFLGGVRLGAVADELVLVAPMPLIPAPLPPFTSVPGTPTALPAPGLVSLPVDCDAAPPMKPSLAKS
ncbi:hypothetical protein [Mesorhizobium sp. B2-1-3A]|uniref:hypothetical protein n=1 Tax=Mesorhizobium sp. B2-1-3A TaxID=2589971 RepID=UPI001129051E|nr:hypothetical protein [Mesorhizobium sp. B2-1-3A]TPM90153.1 hypothetical protein FJ977_34740 [Mesorhizobium sp. B2-1-3A]